LIGDLVYHRKIPLSWHQSLKAQISHCELSQQNVLLLMRFVRFKQARTTEVFAFLQEVMVTEISVWKV